MKFAGVVVLYNPDEEVNKNISSYLNAIEKLYVIDNSSEDNSKKIMKDKKIEYIPLYDNKGIAKALNTGCEKALENNFDYILTMDQDSNFENDDIIKFIDFVKKNKEEKIAIFTPFHRFGHEIKKPEEEVDYPFEVMTSGNLVSLNAYKDVGGFKDWLFIDCVDIEFCMNLRKNGYEICRYNEIELIHHLGNTESVDLKIKKIIVYNQNYIRRYYITRNLLYMYNLYHDTFPEYSTWLKDNVKFQTRNVILFEKDKFRKIRNVWRGIRDYKKNIKGKYPYKTQE